MKWHSPQALADQANDGFLFVLRSTGRIVRTLPSDIVNGVSKVGQVLIGRKEQMVKPQTEPLEAPPARQDATPKAAANDREREASSRDATETAELAPSACSQITIEELPLDEETEQEGPQNPCLDMDALLEGHSPQDRVEAIVLRKALDDLLHGSQEAGAGALETLVGLGRVAEPFLVACSQNDSPQVAEIAIEGLSRIGSRRLIGCISDVLRSSSAELRLVALRAAGRLTDDQQQPLLERGLRDPSPRVRRRALSYLSWQDSYWAIAEIVRLCDDQEPDVQWAALEALMALKPSEARAILRQMVPSLDPAYRRRAAILLKQAKDQGALSEQTEEEGFGQPMGDVKMRTSAFFRRLIRGCKPAPTGAKIDEDVD